VSVSERVCSICLSTSQDTYQAVAPNKLDANCEQDHKVENLIVSCTNKMNGCNWRGDTQVMEEHKKTCLHEMVECQYHSVGYMAKVLRRDLKDHNKANVEEHLALTMSRLRNLENFVHLFVMNDFSGTSDLLEGVWPLGISPLAIMASSGDKVCPVILKMPQFAAKKAAKEKWFSEPFYTSNEGYKMCLCVDPTAFNVTKLIGPEFEKSVNLHIMRGPNDDKLSWPLRGDFTIILLNQLDTYYHSEVMVEFDDNTPAAAACRVVDGEMASTGFGGKVTWLCDRSPSSNSSDSSEDPDWLYLKDDCIFFQVEFETY